MASASKHLTGDSPAMKEFMDKFDVRRESFAGTVALRLMLY
jgi:hypothetical protein